jgi:hypothetical protein
MLFVLVITHRLCAAPYSSLLCCRALFMPTQAVLRDIHEAQASCLRCWRWTCYNHAQMWACRCHALHVHCCMSQQALR